MEMKEIDPSLGRGYMSSASHWLRLRRGGLWLGRDEVGGICCVLKKEGIVVEDRRCVVEMDPVVGDDFKSHPAEWKGGDVVVVVVG